jgi:hypothetical protein
VEGRRRELGRGAALHVGELAALVADDERPLELAEVLGVDAEVRLEGVGDLDPGGHVDERAAREDRAVERRELVVARRDHLAEELPEDLRVLAQRLGRVHEDDALLGDRLLDVRVGRLGVELGLYPGEELALLLGDAEALEGALDVRRDLVPGPLGFLALREVVTNLVEIEGLQVLGRPVGRKRLCEKRLQRFLPELVDPRRLLLDRGDVVHGALVEPRARVEVVRHVVLEVPVGLVDAGDRVVDGGLEGVGDLGHGAVLRLQALANSCFTQS